MGKNSSTAPPAPDPFATASAQTNSNLNTAIANSILGNANVYGPTGSTVYRQIGTTRVGGPAGGGVSSGMTAGNGGGLSRAGDGSGVKGGTAGGYSGEGFDVPQWEQINTLSPEQQVLYDQQVKLGQNLNNFALGQVDRLGSVLGAPISFDGAPNAVTSLNLTKKVGANDWSNDRTKVEEALYSRIQPQLERDRNQTLTRLTNQGIMPGTKAYDNAMAALDRSATDARMQAILAGGQEQSRLAGLEMDQAAFGNNAEQMGAIFANTARDRAIQEILLKRNQPINEISSLMGGGQVSMPQFSQFQGGQMAGTPVGQYVYDSNAIQQAQYQSEQQRRNATTNAMMGGIFGIGSAALTGGLGGGGLRSLGGMGLGAGTGRLY